jgi:hypothetical protein
LDLPRHVPLLITQSVNHDRLGQPLEYGDSRIAADRVEFVIEPEGLGQPLQPEPAEAVDPGPAAVERP